jgi:S1-C subfamily serine protease
MILETVRGSPAAQAGLRAASSTVPYRFRTYPVGGDILIAFQGKEISSPPELAAEIDHLKAGDRVTFTILRESRRMEVALTLQETPPGAR